MGLMLFLVRLPMVLMWWIKLKKWEAGVESLLSSLLLRTVENSNQMKNIVVGVG